MWIISVIKQLPVASSPAGRKLLALKTIARMPLFLRKASKTPGNLTHLEGIGLWDRARCVDRGGVVVEIGSFKGKSTIYLARGLRTRGAALFCVDTWNCDAMSIHQQDVYQEFMSNVSDDRALITPLRGRSDEISGQFSKPVDFLWIDGDHSYEACKADIQHWLPLVRPGGWVGFHDYGNPCGVRRAVDELFHSQSRNSYRVDSIYFGQV